MPVFEYEALSPEGSKITGVMDGESEAAVRAKLRGDGNYPVAVKRSGSSRGGAGASAWFRFSRIRPVELHSFTRQLATLIGASLPLDAALASIVAQTGNQALKRVVADLKESVSEGDPLSRALQAHPREFSPMYVNMVRAGEAFGSLDLVLERLAEFGDRSEALSSKLRTAMIYPAFMTVVGAGVLFILITFVVPDIMQVYERTKAALPLPTRLLMALGSFLGTWWWLLPVALAGALFALRAGLKTERGRLARDRILLKSPVIGALARKSVLFRFSSTMESLLRSGVDIVDSLEISKRVVDNRCIAAVIDDAIEDIRVGRSLTGAFGRSEWFPPTFVQMLAAGEASGRLEDMLGKAAAAGERELETTMQGLTALIEPLLIVIMGILVGFIVLSILLPIFEMNQMIG